MVAPDARSIKQQLAVYGSMRERRAPTSLGQSWGSCRHPNLLLWVGWGESANPNIPGPELESRYLMLLDARAQLRPRQPQQPRRLGLIVAAANQRLDDELTLSGVRSLQRQWLGHRNDRHTRSDAQR